MDNCNDSKKYNDIMNQPHHRSKTRAHMPINDRAAQFSPFSALAGYDDAVEETARMTGQKLELSEEIKSELDAKLALLQEHTGEQPVIAVTYFVPDEKKSGGAYITESGKIKRIDEFERTIIMQNQRRIPFDDIVEIRGDRFY